MEQKNNLNVKQEFLYDENGEISGVIIKYKDFIRLMNKVEDLEDVVEVYKRARKPLKTYSIEQVKKELFADAKK